MHLGIYGTTFGPLILDFSNPAAGLHFDFSVLGVTGPIPDTLIVFTDNAAVDAVVLPGTFAYYDPNDRSLGGSITGHLDYSSPDFPFHQAVVFFAPFPGYIDPITGDPFNQQFLFTVDHISYDTAVPEPATIMVWSLLGGCGIGLGWWRRRKAA